MIFIPHAKKFQKDHSDNGLMDMSFDQLDHVSFFVPANIDVGGGFWSQGFDGKEGRAFRVRELE